jgi:hypothetical protein
MNARISLVANPFPRSVLLAVLHAPTWLTLLIAILPILLVLGIVLYLFAEEKPDNGVTHHQEDDGDPGEDEPPETGSEDVAALRAA